jgi:hypothetical protein
MSGRWREKLWVIGWCTDDEVVGVEVSDDGSVYDVVFSV